MARQKKTVEVPGQESAPLSEVVTDVQNTTEPTPDPEYSALAARNTVLATINEQGAAIIARFEDYAFTDLVGNPLTNCIDFLELVKKATTAAAPAAPHGYVTNEEGKRQPVTGKPVLTEHGWHVPG
ncbi:TPA: hypothetical protein JTN37_004482 [Escherichia coli]|uniref:hypothetical protein n=1 Tax=Escherichia coli TaxID=562 RepID=UPI00301CBD1B|nr:hypothetical protein [Escherichia coli]